MDWVKDFEAKYNRYVEIKTIKAGKFHGQLVINFADGQPHSCQMKREFRGDKEIPLTIK